MERRSFLKGSALCLGIAAASLPAEAFFSTSPTHALRTPAWGRVGDRARKELPVAEIARLDAEAASVIDLLSGSPDVGGNGFRLRVTDEMRQGRTVVIGGVTFSRAEAALFVVASRTPLA